MVQDHYLNNLSGIHEIRFRHVGMSVNPARSLEETCDRIPLLLAAEFERACTLMDTREQEAAEQALEDWLRKNKGQISLESYLKQGPVEPIVFQNITLQRIQITMIKSELSRLLGVYQTCQPKLKTEILKELQKVLSPLIYLYNETQDQELGDLLAKAEARLD